MQQSALHGSSGSGSGMNRHSRLVEELTQDSKFVRRIDTRDTIPLVQRKPVDQGNHLRLGQSGWAVLRPFVVTLSVLLGCAVVFAVLGVVVQSQNTQTNFALIFFPICGAFLLAALVVAIVMRVRLARATAFVFSPTFLVVEYVDERRNEQFTLEEGTVQLLWKPTRTRRKQVRLVDVFVQFDTALREKPVMAELGQVAVADTEELTTALVCAHLSDMAAFRALQRLLDEHAGEHVEIPVSAL